MSGAEVEDPILKDAHYWTEHRLENWARWMRNRESPEGLPDAASGGVKGYTTINTDNVEAYEQLDYWIAEHTDAVINALPPAEKSAIDHEYGITAVYRFPRDNYAMLLLSAKVQVRESLVRRGVWMGD